MRKFSNHVHSIFLSNQIAMYLIQVPIEIKYPDELQKPTREEVVVFTCSYRMTVKEAFQKAVVLGAALLEDSEAGAEIIPYDLVIL